MTYFGFLVRFLIVPSLVLLLIALWDRRRGRQAPAELRAFPLWAAIAIHMLIALVYTTPWDNYLVATNVWWYDAALVTGVTIGWVPIEEYTFFLLQPILAGLWLGFLSRRLALPGEPLRPGLRRWLTVAAGVLWLVMVGILVFNWQPGTYMGLILGWALPPMALQLFFGGDILWRYRRLVFLTIATVGVYLSLADALAISFTIWTIDPAQSLPFLIGGVLPIEEFTFFVITCTLLTFGVTLLLAEESHRRFAAIRRWWVARRQPRVEAEIG